MKTHPMQVVSQILGGVIVTGLTAFTCYRTYSLISLTLPKDQQALGIAGLFAFDLGLLYWAFTAKWGCSSPVQKAIAWIMTGVSLTGVSVAFLTDTFIETAKNGVAGKVDTSWIIIAVWVMAVIILVDLLAFIVFHLIPAEENPPIGAPITGTRYRVLRPVQQPQTQPDYTQLRPLPPVEPERELPAQTATKEADFFTFDALTLGKQLKLKRSRGKK